MSVPVQEPLRRVAMSWEEFLALPDRPRAEWVDGEVVTDMSPVRWSHGDAVVRFGRHLATVLSDHETATEVGLCLPGNRLRAPDLMVIDRTTAALVRASADGWVRTPPVLVVEVLSPSTRAEDTVRKSAEYLEGGAEHYWILDPEERTIDAWRNVEADGVRSWELSAHLGAEDPQGEVEVAGVTVPLDLTVLLH